MSTAIINNSGASTLYKCSMGIIESNIIMLSTATRDNNSSFSPQKCKLTRVTDVNDSALPYFRCAV